MPELRKDYIIDRYVIIANERGKRPDEFKKDRNEAKNNLQNQEKTIEELNKEKKECYFCPGNENLTPLELDRFPNFEKWQIRLFPNKFAAVKQEGNPILKTDNHFFTFSDAFGYHEVLVETPDHEKTLADLSIEELKNVFIMLKKRFSDLSNKSNIKYVSIFKNSGEKAGCSIQHSHCQIIAYNIVPEIIKKKEFFSNQHNKCPYCYIIDIEKNSLRKCFENNNFLAFTPYASRFPFEIWILPKKHYSNLAEIRDNEFYDLSEIMKKIFIKLKELNADYNFYFQYSPNPELKDKMHFHIEICPRLSIQAGFELSTDTYINTISPEDAASFYRS
ncbi:MAG: galactose-1-phosphate uridylyltransferase [Candidatus Woesearchaeota archaeon]